jgi:hypothetical protein
MWVTTTGLARVKDAKLAKIHLIIFVSTIENRSFSKAQYFVMAQKRICYRLINLPFSSFLLVVFLETYSAVGYIKWVRFQQLAT